MRSLGSLAHVRSYCMYVFLVNRMLFWLYSTFIISLRVLFVVIVIAYDSFSCCCCCCCLLSVSFNLCRRLCLDYSCVQFEFLPCLRMAQFYSGTMSNMFLLVSVKAAQATTLNRFYAPNTHTLQLSSLKLVFALVLAGSSN